MLLGASDNFLHIGDGTVDIAAIGAVQPFNGIEVTEFVAIQNDVVAAPDFWNAIGGKADELVGGRPEIHQHRGDDAG